eukprot:TRINITY_DN2253_c0_g2_i2.p1 TRINITY_DN2253_c0_g2~~TRINITY_DN2253_c0_g2_i2.p1  ORF type:complete len:188 (-),score=41.76 TRINITY_DN2253_c0_g2_i2:10-573(-)
MCIRDRHMKEYLNKLVNYPRLVKEILIFYTTFKFPSHKLIESREYAEDSTPWREVPSKKDFSFTEVNELLDIFNKSEYLDKNESEIFETGVFGLVLTALRHIVHRPKVFNFYLHHRLRAKSGITKDQSIKQTMEKNKDEKKEHIDLQKKEVEKPEEEREDVKKFVVCLLYTSPSPRDGLLSRMPSSA